MNNVFSQSPIHEMYFLDKKAGKNLQSLVKLLTEHYKPSKIICFARLMTHINRESCFAEGMSDPYWHYFLLVCSNETNQEHDIQEYVNNHYQEAGVTILCHHVKKVDEALQKGCRFFTTVWRSGCLLYSEDGNMQLVIPRPAEQTIGVALAEKQFKHRFALAEGFFGSAEGRFLHGHYNVCTFLLHQAVEQSTKALIRVFLGYRAEIHSLARLLNLCYCFSEEPNSIFPRNNEEEKQLFQVLSKSYSEARYHDDFRVNEEDAHQLLVRVEKFIRMTERLCKEKIEQLKSEAELSLETVSI